MDKALYFKNNKKNLRLLTKFVLKYNLKLCYNDILEQIYKNENILLCMKKKYIFLYSLTPEKKPEFLIMKQEFSR